MLRVNREVDAVLKTVVSGQVELDQVFEDIFDDLYEHYLNNGEMPYGVAKARDGDPASWVFDRVERDLGL